MTRTPTASGLPQVTYAEASRRSGERAVLGLRHRVNTSVFLFSGQGELTKDARWRLPSA